MTFIYKGLTNDEAEQRLKEIGANELPSAKPKNILVIIAEILQEPMFILLVFCGVLYFIIGDTTEGLILLCWVFVIIFITFYQSLKTEKALSVLKQLATPKATVIRDGIEQKIASRFIVPGDIIILNEGDRIPADGFLLDSTHLLIDESLLTGESLPVIKSVDLMNPEQVTIFSGTMVVQGRAIVKIVLTGIHTQVGKIGRSLQSIETNSTRLQVEMKSLIRKLFFVGGGLSLLVIAAFYFTRGGLILSLINGMATAMAMLPEEFPVVLTVFLAIGSWRLSRRNILTKKASAIENLGAITVLCSDKTGTITENKMHLSDVFFHQHIISSNQFDKYKSDLTPLMQASFFASRVHTVDPMELAIIEASNNYLDNQAKEFKVIKEYPLSNEYFGMTRVYEFDDRSRVAYCKGAPEVIIDQCDLSAKEKSNLVQKLFEMANEGKRVLAVAKAVLSNDYLPALQQEFPFSFIGLIAFEDPIREGVRESVEDCHRAGINVIMITGDNETTALSIAKQAGIMSSGGVLNGMELNALPLHVLREKIKSTCVFARIIPEQKLKIIEALKMNGEVVAMTGDGVNDAPALKAADVAIAMGGRGTDVARETADLVLLDDHFNSIVNSIRQGRKIYDNLQKAFAYIISIHIPIIGLTLIPAFFSTLPLLLLPLHIVFLELIIDPVCSIAFESESEELNVMNRPPRNKDNLFFGIKNILSSISVGVFLFLTVVIVYFTSMLEGHTAAEIRAVTFTSLILGNVFLSISMISKTRSFVAVMKEKNKALYLLMMAALFFLTVLLSNNYLNHLFGFAKLDWPHFVLSISGALFVLIVLEVIKYWRNRRSL
ncbi:MAG: cation-translocating P-type ATPase [Bacteroidota bacterium]